MNKQCSIFRNRLSCKDSDESRTGWGVARTGGAVKEVTGEAGVVESLLGLWQFGDV